VHHDVRRCGGTARVWQGGDIRAIRRAGTSPSLTGGIAADGLALRPTLRHSPLMPTVRIAHELTNAEVRRRMAARVGDLQKLLPGGAGTIEAAWQGRDRMAITVRVMGQVIESAALVERGALVIDYALPKGASFIAPMVEAVIKRAGDKLLLGKG
jgi:hypothetical protein